MEEKTNLEANTKKTGFNEHNIEIGNIELGEEQKAVYDELVSSSSNYFITGKAGTGKSVLLQYFVNNTVRQVAVVAPTGVAALNVGGQTIHSFFSMGLDVQDPSSIDAVANLSNNKLEILKNLEILIIDEISMVCVDVMDMIDAKLRFARKNDKPFGGCQVIVFGDLFQLPPVVTSGQISRYLEDRYNTIYFYGAPSIKENPFKIIELQHIYRQEDKRFVDILNKIRLGECNDKVLNEINTSCVLEPKDDKFITLTSTNLLADRINAQKLAEIKNDEYIYEGIVTGDFKQTIMPTDKTLHLKVGAHVMMLRNDRTDNSSNKKNQKARWVNGTLGIVSYLDPDVVKVNINGVEHSINKEVWHTYKYVYDADKKELCKEEEGSFTQYPIKLAWAITIHKSQGQTYDAVKIDLSNGTFATGQTYVALSRCRSMDYLYLKYPIKKENILVSQEIISYMKDKEIIVSSPTI